MSSTGDEPHESKVATMLSGTNLLSDINGKWVIIWCEEFVINPIIHFKLIKA
jgi:hypothetical protein